MLKPSVDFTKHTMDFTHNEFNKFTGGLLNETKP